MKHVITAGVLSLLFTLSAHSQQEEAVISKKGTTTENQEIIYSPEETPVPMNDLLEGGGGYQQYFYYGDPTGMYLEQKYSPGEVMVKDGEDLNGMFRYNIYHQKVEAIIEGDTFAFAKPDELDWVMIGNRKFVFSSYLRNDYEVASTWFEVLCEGECDLLLRHYIKYRVTDGDDDHTNDQLFKLEAYYSRKKDESGKRLHTSKKDIPLVLIDHQEKLAKFLKENKLNLKDQDDLVRLFAYYNSLE